MSTARATSPGLTDEQIASFHDIGYVQSGGLVSPELCRAAEEAIWRGCGVDRDDPASWPEGWFMPPEAFDLPEVQACGTPALRGAIDQLAGRGRWLWGPFGRQRPGVGAIIIFPHRGQTEWTSPLVLRDDPRPSFVHFYPHIDEYGDVEMSGSRRFACRVLRKARLARPSELSTFVLSVMVYLHNVPERHGGTLLWPESFRASQERANESGVKPAKVVKQRLLEPGENAREMTGAAGDTLLYTRNLIHSPSLNLSSRPRVALQVPVHLTRAGLRRCRRGTTPRSPVERIYDEHMAAPEPFDYFCA